MPRRAPALVLTLALVSALAAPALAAGLAQALPGDQVSFASNPDVGSIAMPFTAVSGGPTLLLSDAPEEVPSPGILYQDDVNGPFRLLFDHVDASTAGGDLVFSVLATNQGATPTTITLTRVGVAGPSADYLQTGQAAQKAWMGSVQDTVLTVPPGQTISVLPQLGGMVAAPGQDVTGTIDGSTGGDLVVSVVAQSRATPSLSGLTVLPAPTSSTGFALRGTFPHADITITAQADGALQRLDMASPTDYLHGYSAVDGLAPAEDYGNYGVLYNVLVMVMGNPGPLAAIFDPQGGPFAGTALVGTGFQPGSLVDLPSGGTFSPSPLSSILMGQFQLQPGAPLLLHVQWMPPSGSFLPTSLILSPD